MNGYELLYRLSEKNLDWKKLNNNNLIFSL